MSDLKKTVPESLLSCTILFQPSCKSDIESTSMIVKFHVYMGVPVMGKSLEPRLESKALGFMPLLSASLPSFSVFCINNDFH